MTRHHAGTDAGQHRMTPDRTPRLRLKAKAPLSGYVDGAWWPSGDDLAAELPDLLAVLSVRLGRIDRVLYNPDDWASAPAILTVGGHKVHLDGYRHQPAHSVEILGLDRGRIVLLVVPWRTDPEDAHTMLMAAARPDDTSTVNDLLAPSSAVSGRPTQPAGSAQARWESEGGSGVPRSARR